MTFWVAHCWWIYYIYAIILNIYITLKYYKILKIQKYTLKVIFYIIIFLITITLLLSLLILKIYDLFWFLIIDILIIEYPEYLNR